MTTIAIIGALLFGLFITNSIERAGRDLARTRELLEDIDGNLSDIKSSLDTMAGNRSDGFYQP